MRPTERYIADLVRKRGLAAIWHLAAVAAILPYIIAPTMSSVIQADAASASRLAVSLAATLFVLSCLRCALELHQSGKAYSGGEPALSTDLQDTALAVQQTGLASHEALSNAVNDHDGTMGRALMGYVSFVNYPAMSAFNPLGARRVLDIFANRLEQALGSKRLAAQTDVAGFAIWFAEPTAEGTARDELRSIGYVLAQEIEDADMTVSPDVHVGTAWRCDNSEAANALVARAQAAATPLKRFAQAAAAPDSSSHDLADRFAIEQALRRAVREGQLYLNFQPFVDIASGKVVGAEALLRWRHPTMGNISPAEIVPLLEETGLVHEIGLWTLNRACRHLSEWRADGRSHLRVAINLSAVQLQNPSLLPLIERTVAAHGLLPADIEFELTETAAMEDEIRTLELFQDLRSRGFGIAIDDFGNGHSNLRYLKKLPFTKLKIDREFVTHIDTQPGSQAICKALIELAQGLGISVLAEGAERFEEVQTLRRLGCTVFQGFYFARPMAAEDLTAKMAEPEWLAIIGSDVHRARAEVQNRIVS